VKRGDRIVEADKELIEKLGGKDPCPCGSGRRFQALLPFERPTRWSQARLLRPRLDRAASEIPETGLKRRLRHNAACGAVHAGEGRVVLTDEPQVPVVKGIRPT
jgi:hypothetical protein